MITARRITSQCLTWGLQDLQVPCQSNFALPKRYVLHRQHCSSGKVWTTKPTNSLLRAAAVAVESDQGLQQDPNSIERTPSTPSSPPVSLFSGGLVLPPASCVYWMSVLGLRSLHTLTAAMHARQSEWNSCMALSWADIRLQSSCLYFLVSNAGTQIVNFDALLPLLPENKVLIPSCPSLVIWESYEFSSAKIFPTCCKLNPQLFLQPSRQVSAGAFQRIPQVPVAEDHLRSALRKANRINGNKKIKGKLKNARNLAARRLNALTQELSVPLGAVIKAFPSFRQLHPFEKALLDLTIGTGVYEKRLEELNSLRKSCLGVSIVVALIDHAGAMHLAAAARSMIPSLKGQIARRWKSIWAILHPLVWDGILDSTQIYSVHIAELLLSAKPSCETPFQ